MNILLNYQVPVYTQRILELEQNFESNMLMATGTGKTVVSAHIARYYLAQGFRGLFLYNENNGLQQAEKTYRAIIGNDISYSQFYGQSTKDWNADKAQMLFASFQSLNSIHGKWYEIFPKDHFYFIVIDESHHDQAPTYKEVIDYFEAKKLRMTATPQDDTLWNTTKEVITLPQAIANGWLSQVEYHLLSDGINNRKLKQIMREVLNEGKRISVTQLNETIFLQKRTNKELAVIKRRAGAKQTMIFCENIIHAQHVMKTFKSGTAGIVHSKLSEKRNHDTLESFRNKKIQFIISIDKFNEAIDIPDAEVIVFLRATNAKRIFFQQLGRGLRKTATKDKVIILDFVGNVERLVMVTELGKQIQEESEKLTKNFNLSKNLFHITGKYYDLDFTETVFKDILEIVKAINTGFLSYAELKKEVAEAGVTSSTQYREAQKTRPSWPSNLEIFYTEWIDWYDFFGRVKPSSLSFEELKKEVRDEGINFKSQYLVAQKTRSSWSSNPDRSYPEWTNWSEFFGREKSSFLSFEELKKEVRDAGITSSNQYAKAQKTRPSWPGDPAKTCSKWTNWPEFFGREKSSFLSFEELKKEVKIAGITSSKQYAKAQKTRPSWPSNLDESYSEWIDWYEFFGREKVNFLSFEELKKEVKMAGISSQPEYKEAQKTQPSWPSNPNGTYSEWIDWYDFFGKEKPIFLSFEELKKEVKMAGISSAKQYLAAQKTRPLWPSHLHKLYSEWTSWNDFLISEKPSFLSFEELKKEVKMAGISSQLEYKEAQKTRPSWPSNPNRLYPEWIDWYDFLGKANVKKK